MTGRAFSASLKPAWSPERIQDFNQRLEGTATVFIINHDKDKDNEGNDIEVHTHILIEYDTPRKISTVANLLEVEPNFIEVVRNKKAMLRYLTHLDDKDKYQYEPSEVYTNSASEYSKLILGASMSDKDIADYILQGRGIELLGVVSSSKLRTIQSFLHFDATNQQTRMIRELKTKIDTMGETLETIGNIAVGFSTALDMSVKDLTNGFVLIAEEIKKARLRVR